MNWIRIVLMSVAVGFLIQPVVGHHGQAVDSDKDGINNIEDVCPYMKDHFKCLDNAGLWKWPVRLGTMETPESKFNSIRTCMDLSDWKNTLFLKLTYWTGIAAAAASTGAGLLASGVAIGMAGSFGAAHLNASDVYDKLCKSRY